jgi:hypothetical protein
VLSAGIARSLEISQSLIREACVLHRLPNTSTVYWQGWNRLRANIGDKFRAVFKAVSQAMARTPRSSPLVENLNSRLRNYFTLRRIWVVHTWTCCGSSSTIDATCAANFLTASAKARGNR